MFYGVFLSFFFFFFLLDAWAEVRRRMVTTTTTTTVYRSVHPSSCFLDVAEKRAKTTLPSPPILSRNQERRSLRLLEEGWGPNSMHVKKK
jgi:hypothetical protein